MLIQSCQSIEKVSFIYQLQGCVAIASLRFQQKMYALRPGLVCLRLICNICSPFNSFFLHKIVSGCLQLFLGRGDKKSASFIFISFGSKWDLPPFFQFKRGKKKWQQLFPLSLLEGYRTLMFFSHLRPCSHSV